MYLRLLAAASVLALVVAALSVIFATPGGPAPEESVAESSDSPRVAESSDSPRVKTELPVTPTPSVPARTSATPQPHPSRPAPYWPPHPEPLGFSVEGTGDKVVAVDAVGLLVCRASVTGNVTDDGTPGYFRVKIIGSNSYDLFSSEIAEEVEDSGYIRFATVDLIYWDALWPPTPPVTSPHSPSMSTRSAMHPGRCRVPRRARTCDT